MPTTLDRTLGATEIGGLASTVLFGVVTVQTWTYIDMDFNDPLFLRTLVGVVWILETLHTLFLWIYLYSLTVTNYGRPSTIGGTHWSVASNLAFTAWIGAIVHSFFAHRLRHLSGSLVVAIIIWTAGLWRAVLGTVAAVEFFMSTTVVNFLTRHEWIVTTLCVVNAMIDVFIAVVSCFCLLRRRSGFKRTQRIVAKLVMYAIETGLIISMCGVIILILSLVVRHDLVGFALWMIYSKLCSNAFLTALNTRKALRQREDQDITHVWSSGVFRSPTVDIEDPTFSSNSAPEPPTPSECPLPQMLPAAKSEEDVTKSISVTYPPRMQCKVGT